ncbi:hypothetical protein A2U01_0093756, partial [Trifolium medium]|nr:hypothetical protein [Trifolium medium]
VVAERATTRGSEELADSRQEPENIMLIIASRRQPSLSEQYWD